MGYWDQRKQRLLNKYGLGASHPAETGIPDQGLMRGWAQRDVKDLVGTRQQPYQMDEAELFPGESQATLAPGLMTKGSGLVGGEKTPLEFYGGLMAVPGYENVGAQGVQSLMNRTVQQQKPTGIMQNLSAAGYQAGTPEYQQALKDYIMKSGTTINMGAKHITAADAQQMRGKDDKMPPIGMNWEDAANAGFRFINKQEESEAGKQKEVIGSMQQAFDAYKTELKNEGVKAPWEMFTDPKSYNKVSAAYGQLQLEYKELAKLGVLTGPDMGLIESVMQDPTSIRSNAAAYFAGGNPLVDQLDIVEEKLAQARKRAAARYGKNWRQTKTLISDMSDKELEAIAGGQ